MSIDLATVAALSPQCASDCSAQVLATGVCAAVDAACFCANEAFMASVETCVLANCTVREALSAQNLTSTFCGVDPVVNHSFTSIFIAFCAMAALAVILRIYARVRMGVKLWWDDYCNFLGLLGCVAATISLVEQSKLGLGRNLWAVPQGNISQILTLSYMNFLLYSVAGCLIRESIALFYLRVFGAKKVIIATIVLIFVAHVPFIFLEIFPCQPISLFWNQWDGEHAGTCINTTLEVWLGAAVTLGLDIWLAVLPMPILAKLKLSRSRKLAVLGMFAFGLVITGVSIARIPAIRSFQTSTNFTAAYIPTAMWSDIELEVGIICACLPSLRALFAPFLKSKTTEPSGASGPNKLYQTIGSKDGGGGGWSARNKGKMGLSDVTVYDEEEARSESHLPLNEYASHAQSVDVAMTPMAPVAVRR